METSRRLHTVMLGINDPDQHTQPMTAFAEPDVNMIWFFTSDDLDLALEAKAGKDARLIMISTDQKIFADIRGTLDTGRDHAQRRRGYRYELQGHTEDVR